MYRLYRLQILLSDVVGILMFQAKHDQPTWGLAFRVSGKKSIEQCLKHFSVEYSEGLYYLYNVCGIFRPIWEILLVDVP